MGTTEWIVLAVVVGALVIVALAMAAYSRSRGSTALRDRFGPEYDRTVGAAGSRRRAEQELLEREQLHDSLDIQPLTEAARERYTDAWRRTEQLFVDDPELAAREAERIVRDVLADRGYPNDDLDTQAAAVSVDHPKAVQRYRHGHDMVHASNGKQKDSERRTENLRLAMVDFRAVFEQLVEPELEHASATR
ncbi:MAG TPA: hypothetical protein VHH57_07465 [Gaiella sp.]|jgi:hypothetical protein|nr:hypothetical protein [Gaiella sp.]